MKYYIGKTFDSVLGDKRLAPRYLFETIHDSKKMCEKLTNFLAGFGAYEVVQIEIKEVKSSGKSGKLKGKKKK